MTNLRPLSAALLAAAVIGAPAMAREQHFTSQYGTTTAYVGSEPDTALAAEPGPAYPGYGYSHGYRCVPAPRVGAYASQPWDNDVPCEP